MKGRRVSLAALLAATLGLGGAEGVMAQVAAESSFAQALVGAATADGQLAQEIAAFYDARDYAPLWTGPQDGARRASVLQALASAADQGLPAGRYGLDALQRAFSDLRTEGDRGRLEAALTHAVLLYAHDLSGGMLTPAAIDKGIVRAIHRPSPGEILAGLAGAGDPGAYLASLAPAQPAYANLIREKLLLEAAIAGGGWGGEVPEGTLRPGDNGPAVVALRDRLVAMGRLEPNARADYDPTLAQAVMTLQKDSGLIPTGLFDEETRFAVNRSPESRLGSVIVALERLRWMDNAPLGARHIWVNQPDFTARIVDDGRVTFQTRAVIGNPDQDRRSPEFSDQMEFMVANPTWNVPRSITIKEYLPELQADPTAVSHLNLIDQSGRVVSREGIDFAAFTPEDFPFDLKQDPSEGNALGKVKFMFPNANNIYLHDTPQKSFFAKEVRAFSHGCIRLADPTDFAYTLLSRQTDDPKGVFARALAGGNETIVNFATPIPVHLVYFTAWPEADGTMTWRRDIYGRDKRILAALQEAGVALAGAGS